MKFFGRVAFVWCEATQKKIEFVDGVAEATTPQEINFLRNHGFKMITEPEKEVKKGGKKK